MTRRCERLRCPDTTAASRGVCLAAERSGRWGSALPLTIKVVAAWQRYVRCEGVRKDLGWHYKIFLLLFLMLFSARQCAVGVAKVYNSRGLAAKRSVSHVENGKHWAPHAVGDWRNCSESPVKRGGAIKSKTANTSIVQSPRSILLGVVQRCKRKHASN